MSVRRRAMLALVTVSALVALFGGVGLLHAEREVAPEEVAAIARELNCPVCQGYNLHDCPLPVCADWRNLIRERLAAGKTKDEVIDEFVQEYGPEVLNVPPREGYFLIAWVLPVVALAVGAVLVALLLRRRTSRLPRRVVPGPESAPGPAYVARLEELVTADDDTRGASPEGR